MSARLLAAADAVKLIPDKAVVAVSSSSGLGCPDAVLKALGARFDADARPRDLTMIMPIAAGDMYGITGIDHVAKPGLLARTIAGSYPSGPSNRPSPAIWRMIGDDAIEAYNVPSGILFDMFRDVAAKRAGVLTKVGLDTFVDPRRDGCKMNAVTTGDIVRVVEFDGQEWLHFPGIAPEVAVIRGTTADELGNASMEHEGAYLGTLELAVAAN